jgi:hypothetical protein
MKISCSILLIIFLISYLQCKSDFKEFENIAIEFTKKIIKEPMSLDSILKNDNNIKIGDIYKDESNINLITGYKNIIISQNKSDFELNDVVFQRYKGLDSSIITVNYKKNNSFLYEFFISWFTSGCKDNVYYKFEIINYELYFRGVFICQHMEAKDIE